MNKKLRKSLDRKAELMQMYASGFVDGHYWLKKRPRWLKKTLVKQMEEGCQKAFEKRYFKKIGKGLKKSVIKSNKEAKHGRS